jgi:hypothetical protein
LTAGMVAAVFHHQRVLPLMQRRLRIDEMTLEVSLEGSWMSHDTLPSTRLPGAHGGWWAASSRRTSTGSRCDPTCGKRCSASLESFCFLVLST